MTNDAPGEQQVRLYRTPLHPCPYLPDRQASNLVVDPAARLRPGLYQRLLELGFRRSGEHVYRPDCPACRRCIATRIPTRDFRPRRSQRRAWKAAIGRLSWIERPASIDPEHYALYGRYLSSRHPGGEMAKGAPEDYLGFLTSSWGETRFFELREDKRLVAVAVSDLTDACVSSVYTFFDPGAQVFSPGVLCILWQVREALARGKDWVYLGFWVPGCRKMEYKLEFRPVEILSEQRWRHLDRREPIDLPELR
jgi:arginine-tRNA-protein transferase